VKPGSASESLRRIPDLQDITSLRRASQFTHYPAILISSVQSSFIKNSLTELLKKEQQ
jgi:hypothetical protein